MPSRRNLQPGPDQESFFSPSVGVLPPVDMNKVPTIVSGAYHSLDDRASYFETAIREINQANSRAGLQKNANGSGMEELINRYGPAVDHVLDGALANERRHVQRAKANVMKLAGVAILDQAGFPQISVRRMSTQMYRTFTALYGVDITIDEVRSEAAAKVRRTADATKGHKA